jgi:hypothetical protein
MAFVDIEKITRGAPLAIVRANMRPRACSRNPTRSDQQRFTDRNLVSERLTVGVSLSAEVAPVATVPTLVRR